MGEKHGGYSQVAKRHGVKATLYLFYGRVHIIILFYHFDRIAVQSVVVLLNPDTCVPASRQYSTSAEVISVRTVTAFQQVKLSETFLCFHRSDHEYTTDSEISSLYLAVNYFKKLKLIAQEGRVYAIKAGLSFHMSSV